MFLPGCLLTEVHAREEIGVWRGGVCGVVVTVNDRREKVSKGLVLHSLQLLVSVCTAMVGWFSACFSLVVICSFYLGKDEHMIVGENQT